MHRPTKRLTRTLVCAAAVPAVLVVAGCSSGSGSDSAKDDSQAKASASTSGAKAKKVAPATYKELPQACDAFSKSTLKDLVPKGESKAGASDDESTRASCSWSSLDNNGVKGSQFRWLNASFVRFDSDVNRGSGDKLAEAYYAKQIKDAKATSGAKDVKSAPVSKTGDVATQIGYDRKYKDKKDTVTSKQQTVVSRVDNVVVTVDYNGSGLAGDDAPSASSLSKDAQKAAKEAVAKVIESAKGGAKGGASSDSSGSPKPSASESKKPKESESKKGA
ncbi:DUF3558 domain-containing protein [Streptomyces sp. NPDC102360]|uniref:DUF3558 domain-containing protein n=1 Tax=Streptomyces sp. NPDC102360 TaxID=3366160 RepID=UPI003825EBEF